MRIRKLGLVALFAVSVMAITPAWADESEDYREVIPLASTAECKIDSSWKPESGTYPKFWVRWDDSYEPSGSRWWYWSVEKGDYRWDPDDLHYGINKNYESLPGQDGGSKWVQVKDLPSGSYKFCLYSRKVNTSRDYLDTEIPFTIMLDNTSPELTISFDENLWASPDAGISVSTTATDNNSGIQKIEYCIIK